MRLPDDSTRRGLLSITALFISAFFVLLVVVPLLVGEEELGAAAQQQHAHREHDPVPPVLR
jgi:hypothetical protein